MNASIGFFEEWKAQGEVPLIATPRVLHLNSSPLLQVNALRASLKTHASVKRDGTFVTLQSSLIVPGDIFLLKGMLLSTKQSVQLQYMVESFDKNVKGPHFGASFVEIVIF